MASSAQVVAFLAALLSAPAIAEASGSTMPASAELDYSFSCPSGPKGRIEYATQWSPSSNSSHFVLQVGGRSFEDDPRVVEALKGKRITAVEAACSPGLIHVMFSTWHANDRKPGTVTIGIDPKGKISFVEA